MKRKTDWLKRIQIAAKERGGKCLSKECYKATSKVKLICLSGHKWVNSAFNILNLNQWCKICALRINGIDIANKIAKQKNGKCLSHTYNGNKEKLLWKCNYGHIWKASLNTIKSKNCWCPRCYDKRRHNNRKLKNGIYIANKIAIKNGGICLSSEYKNTMTKLQWQCSKNHKWQASLNSIKDKGSWCPDCSFFKIAEKSNISKTLRHWKTGEKLICQGSWEFKVVKYLNSNKINFRWQPRSFKMPDGRRYHPDLYLFSTKKWIEIKGYFWDDAKEKWDWFQTIKPNSELWNEDKLKIMGIL